MAFLGNADATGSGNGPMYFSAAADMTGMSAGQMATIKLGTTGTATDTGAVYVLRNNAGTRSWVIVS